MADIAFTAEIERIEFVTENLPPLQVGSFGQEPTGAMVELIKLIANEAEVDADIRVYPWARAYKQALETPNTFIFSMRKSPERIDSFHWVGELYNSRPEIAILARRDDIMITDNSHLHAFRIGVVRGDYDQLLLENMGLKENLHLALSYKELWQMLILGRLDCVLTTKVVAQQALTDLNINRDLIRLIYQIPETNAPLYLAANIQTKQDLIIRLHQALAKIKADGRYQQIINKWQL